MSSRRRHIVGAGGERSIEVVAGGVAIAGDRILVTDDAATAWLGALGEPLDVAPHDVDDFFAQLAATPDLPAIHVDPALEVEIRSEPPRPRLSIERTGSW